MSSVDRKAVEVGLRVAQKAAEGAKTMAGNPDVLKSIFGTKSLITTFLKSK